MALHPDRIQALGDELFAALRERRTLAPLTEREAGIDIDDAYRISLRLLQRRQAQGERVIGKKIGVTSKPVQDMLGVHQPDFGFLTDRMQVKSGAVISIAGSGLIQPRAEGEIAFVLKKDLKGPGVNEDQVLDATDYVLPCFEIVDSRIEDWKIKIQDTVADNASCGVFVLGEDRVKPHALDLAAVKMDIHKNGAHIASGLGSAVQGHPATAVAWLANTLGAFGIPFLAGEIILSGSLAPLLPALPGDRFAMTLAGIGEAWIGFEA
ncbi:2-oxopent-4-enoate/cis-2-oxohex-4-enoate hydratase [Solimonas aquatica]|uniref:2-oxopent-4-enoate/cis-2-oxohex-4-enoate hydratase n=1 Tax=Solimonas aquatica TaxID=489703 RepID=A0A1H9KWH1_9GAMM|nr:fumarylacetoacetate hydrolase family protein [Solimonas aquatica]SER03133.1 2-oxopent-4-enoate/cis-2-oxohex-4-enoate hydratase [Solimonas aquatica]